MPVKKKKPVPKAPPKKEKYLAPIYFPWNVKDLVDLKSKELAEKSFNKTLIYIVKNEKRLSDLNTDQKKEIFTLRSQNNKMKNAILEFSGSFQYLIKFGDEFSIHTPLSQDKNLSWDNEEDPEDLDEDF